MVERNTTQNEKANTKARSRLWDACINHIIRYLATAQFLLPRQCKLIILIYSKGLFPLTLCPGHMIKGKLGLSWGIGILIFQYGKSDLYLIYNQEYKHYHGKLWEWLFANVFSLQCAGRRGKLHNGPVHLSINHARRNRQECMTIRADVRDLKLNNLPTNDWQLCRDWVQLARCQGKTTFTSTNAQSLGTWSSKDSNPVVKIDFRANPCWCQGKIYSLAPNVSHSP